SFRQRGAKPEMSNKRVEVPITEEQREPALDAARGNHSIDGLAHRNTKSAQRAEIPSRFNSNILAADLNNLQRRKQFHCLVEISLGGKGLQYLREDQVASHHRFDAQQGIESLCFWRRDTAEMVYPYAGIDQNHRSVLMASRSPCHLSLPRNRRI